MFDEFIGPRHLVYAAALEMHPLDTENRAPRSEAHARRRLLQHHEVLHQGLSREHHDHRQRDHPVEGAGDRSAVRPGRQAVPSVALLTQVHVEGPMEFQLKTLSPEAVARALARAERYRLLNEPGEAESICLDALEVAAGQPGGAHHAAARADRAVRRRRVVRRRSVGDRRTPAATTTSAPTTRASSTSAAPRRGSGTARPAAARRPTNGCATR